MNTTLAFIELTDPLSNWLRSVMLKPSNSDASLGVWGTDNCLIFITWLNILFGATVVLPMLYFMVKYRRRPGVPAIRTPNHNTLLEITWVVGPLAILTGLFFWGFQGYMRAQVSQAGAEIINVEGWKWQWEATYPNGAKSPVAVYLDDHTNQPPGAKIAAGVRGNSRVPVFVLPAGVPVKFMLKSRDVMHSFYIPDMRVKTDLFPNRYTSISIVPQDADKNKSGVGQLSPILPTEAPEGRDHYVFCAEYCGQQHSEMAAIIRVVSKENYAKTLTAWGDVESGLSPVDLGKFIHERKCASCHTVDGSKNTGPTWKGAYGTDFKFADGSTLLGGGGDVDTVWTNYIKESIVNPASKIHEGFPNQMTSFAGQLDDRQIAGITAYFRALAGKSKPEDSVQPVKK